ncbi:SIR2 family protein [Asticcacaulis sp.]|uniref:SIR2 family NAD-dependent protein deacylase n=1 Tax=Asticcacaulis sp. TaxID=1872648 RepID=UPI002BB21062|nr:SIR2 family protein [Asticcacaulis sp.]HTM81558.1 SIR2 family protein [Asticcacaulis sp.]
MSEYFEIAYAAVSKRLCFFTGTGFSKAISANTAPSWQGLLETICDKCDNPGALKAALFPIGKINPLSLEEAAQVLAIELQTNDLGIHDEIAALIEAVKLGGDNTSIEEFCSLQSFRVITTNYDKLMEKLIGENDCLSITPGLPIPRSTARVKVYHVHGSVDSPVNMVVTSDDYFKFINGESYFSRKLSTVLHENTIVILGYSLGDTNLKAILSDYKNFSRNHVIGGNIFLVSRSAVDKTVKDYYAHCYGIRVLDGVDVHTFFKDLNSSLPIAQKCINYSVKNIQKIVSGKHFFSEEYLRVENSFFEIVVGISALGLSIDSKEVVLLLDEVIKAKITLTGADGAWDQYEHLAKWLIYLATILELKGTSIEKTFLRAAKKSMESMRSEKYVGYSWHAFNSWNFKWDGIIAANRSLIRKYITEQSNWADALLIVNRN